MRLNLKRGIVILFYNVLEEKKLHFFNFQLLFLFLSLISNLLVSTKPKSEYFVKFFLTQILLNFFSVLNFACSFSAVRFKEVFLICLNKINPVFFPIIFKPKKKMIDKFCTFRANVFCK